MGTNYYLYKENCVDCIADKPNHRLHLGKQSYGWEFMIHGYVLAIHHGFHVTIRSKKEMFRMIKQLLNSGWGIADEYNEEIDFHDFKEMVEASTVFGDKPAKNHYDVTLRDRSILSTNSTDHKDSEGWSVTYCDFS